MMTWYREGDMGVLATSLMFLAWLFILGGGILIVTFLTRSENIILSEATPRQILDRRFASGELSAEDYAQSIRILGGHGVEQHEAQ